MAFVIFKHCAVNENICGVVSFRSCADDHFQACNEIKSAYHSLSDPFAIDIRDVYTGDARGKAGNKAQGTLARSFGPGVGPA